MKKEETFTTGQTAEMVGIHRETLLRWLRDGQISEPRRDRNGWRRFSASEVDEIYAYANREQTLSRSSNSQSSTPSILDGMPYVGVAHKLEELDWDFVDAQTSYLTHSIHPYPAKFIPQIPNTLIQELSSVGEIILDPFCGSGTTLVEGVRLRRHAVGVDANPLACLLSQAKTTVVDENEVAPLRELVEEFLILSQQMSVAELPLFPDLPALPFTSKHPPFKGAEDWFDAHVIDELAFAKEKCLALESEVLRNLALVAFSSIIVTVSRQDSDTRYVRRDKNIAPGETLRLFSRALEQVTQRVVEFSSEAEKRFTARVIEADILDEPDVGIVDLVVCSPPYPNAYSYHLYHRTRMLWMDMDQPRFKKQEIGSHRKYSSKGQNAATVETFRGELETILRWLSRHLRQYRHACFVIGDSIIKGELIPNSELLMQVAEGIGFEVEADIERELQSNKKYFNPKIGRIKTEHIVILRNHQGA